MMAKSKSQQGATFLVSLVMLLVVLMLSASMAGMAHMGVKAVRNETDKQIAMHAAEAALIDAEKDIEKNSSPFSRSALFAANSDQGFIASCGRGDDNEFQGLCMKQGVQQRPVWLTVDISSMSQHSPSVKFGRFTGQTMPVGLGSFPSRLPRYLIELLIDPEIDQSEKPSYIYRITALGFGTDPSTQIVLQSVYRKAGISETVKTGRLSWREIANWQDLIVSKQP